MASADVFMDSAGFLALWDATDGYHRAAARLQQELIHNRRRFVTSESIVGEDPGLRLGQTHLRSS
jgi:hypothetical protein